MHTPETKELKKQKLALLSDYDDASFFSVGSLVAYQLITLAPLSLVWFFLIYLNIPFSGDVNSLVWMLAVLPVWFFGALLAFLGFFTPFGRVVSKTNSRLRKGLKSRYFKLFDASALNFLLPEDIKTKRFFSSLIQLQTCANDKNNVEIENINASIAHKCEQFLALSKNKEYARQQDLKKIQIDIISLVLNNSDQLHIFFAVFFCYYKSLICAHCAQI